MSQHLSRAGKIGRKNAEKLVCDGGWFMVSDWVLLFLIQHPLKTDGVDR